MSDNSSDIFGQLPEVEHKRHKSWRNVWGLLARKTKPAQNEESEEAIETRKPEKIREDIINLFRRMVS